MSLHSIPQPSPAAYSESYKRAQEAFHSCLQGNIYHAQELLLRVRNELKRISGDLPIVGRNTPGLDLEGVPFATRCIEEAQAWGWLEMASGVFHIISYHPGASLVHFKRAWRIWRPWETDRDTIEQTYQVEAQYERIRATLWLGEAWARVMSDRAEQVARAVLRAALKEIQRTGNYTLLQETLAQQAQLPPASPGTPAYQQQQPYIQHLLQSNNPAD